MRGVVAAGDEKSAKAAIEILRAGGNAFDAACGALLAAPLCEPMLTSLGGGGFMMASRANGTPRLYDFFVDVPLKRSIEPDFFPIYVDFGGAIQEFHIGASSIAVPGMVAGIERVNQELGSMPLSEIIKPALRYAKEGIYLTPLQASFVKLLEPILLSTKEAKELYAPNGKLIDEKSKIRNLEYASFLEAFAKEGAKIFYEGEVAKEIDKISKERGGEIRYEDLKSYRVYLREPLEFEYYSQRVYTNPPPSAGGVLIAFILQLIERDKERDIEYFKDLIESMVVASEFRKSHIDSKLHSPAIKEALKRVLIEEYRVSKRSRINLWGNTTHISVIDKFGNGASVTSTNGEGSGVVVKSAGIMLNNMLGEEDLNPNGFFKWPAGVRLPSMMAPTIVKSDKGVELVLGSAGSNRIRSAIVQVVENFIKFDMDIQRAIDEPRLHYERGELFFEPGFLKELIELAKRLYRVNEFESKSLFFGGVNGVTGDYKGGADGRRGGAVLFE